METLLSLMQLRSLEVLWFWFSLFLGSFLTKLLSVLRSLLIQTLHTWKKISKSQHLRSAIDSQDKNLNAEHKATGWLLDPYRNSACSTVLPIYTHEWYLKSTSIHGHSVINTDSAKNFDSHGHVMAACHNTIFSCTACSSFSIILSHVRKKLHMLILLFQQKTH